MKKLRLLFPLIVSLILTVSLSMPVFAAPVEPTDVTINSIKVFQNIYTTGDMLFVVGNVDISYGSSPDTEEAEYILFQLYDTNGTTLLQNRAFSERNTLFITAPADHGYGMNSIYFDATAAAALTWNSAYVIRVTASPVVFSTITEGTHMQTVTLSAGDWVSGALTESRDLLSAYIIQRINALENYTTVTLTQEVTEGTIVNSAGRDVVTSAIPGIDEILSNLFDVSGRYLTIEQGTPTGALESAWSMSTQLGAQFNTKFNNLGSYLGVSGATVGALYGLILIIAIAAIALVKVEDPKIVPFVAIPSVLLCVFSGLISMGLVFAVILVLGVLFAMHFFLGRG